MQLISQPASKSHVRLPGTHGEAPFAASVISLLGIMSGHHIENKVSSFTYAMS